MKKDHKVLNTIVSVLSFAAGCFAMGIFLQNHE